MAKTRILVVDDEQGMLEVCADTLSKLPDTEILVEQQSIRAAERIAMESVDLLIADIQMPGLNGMDLLRLVRQQDPNTAVLTITAYPTVETAVECMKLGAADYITKPFIPEDLLAVVRRLLEGKQLRDENLLLRRQVERAYAFGEILGKSQVMQKVFESIQRVAETDFDVVIVETGTGKEVVAGPFINAAAGRTQSLSVDCGAILTNSWRASFSATSEARSPAPKHAALDSLRFASKGTFFLDGSATALAPAIQAAPCFAGTQDPPRRRHQRD